VAAALKVFANRTRILILCALHERELQTKDLVERTGRPYPSVVQHLSHLLRKGVIAKDSSKRYPVYRLKERATVETLFAVCDLVCRPSATA